MLQRIMMLLFSVLIFMFFMSMLVLMWYIALPIMIVLFVLTWWRVRQVRKLWQKAFYQTQEKTSSPKKPIEHTEVIDAEYTEL